MQWRSIYQLFYLLWFSQECEARAFVSPSPVSATRVQDDQEPNKLVPNCMATWVSVLCHFRKKLCLQMMRKVSSRLILAARISELLEFSWGWISPTAQGQQFLIIPEQREREREMQQIRDRAYSAQAINSSLQQQGYYHKHSCYSCHSPCGRLLQWFLLLCHLLEYWTQNKFFTFAHSLTAQPQNFLRKKEKKKGNKVLKVKIKQLFNNMNCTKLVHLQLQKLRCIDSKAATSIQPKPIANQLL
jgi:hypothetical protein